MTIKALESMARAAVERAIKQLPHGFSRGDVADAILERVLEQDIGIRVKVQAFYIVESEIRQ